MHLLPPTIIILIDIVKEREEGETPAPYYIGALLEEKFSHYKRLTDSLISFFKSTISYKYRSEKIINTEER